MSERRNWLQEGIGALRTGDRIEARRCLERAVAEDPDNIAAWWFLAAVRSNVEQKIEALRQVLRLRPEHAEAQLLLTRLEQGAPEVRPLADERIPASSLEDETQETVGARAQSDTLVAAAAVGIALLAILVTILLVWTGLLSAELGVRGPNLQGTEQALVLGVPACTTTLEGDTVLVFINNTDVTVDVLRGAEGSRRALFSLDPGEQGNISARPNAEVRYVVETDEPGLTGSSTSYQVPPGNMCRVPIQ